jgi:hypothetical protein
MERLERHRYVTGAHWFVALGTTVVFGIGACSDDEQSAPQPSSGAAGMLAAAGEPSAEQGGFGGADAGAGGQQAGAGGETAAGMAGMAEMAGMAGEMALAGAGGCAAPDTDALPPTSTAPPTLAETGLYSNAAPLTLAAHVHHYVPKYPLWSDGADKDRYIYLPPCSTIDTSDMDHWKFPVGTRLWKTFTVPSSGAGAGKRIETRLLHRYGSAQGNWLFAAYQWDESAPDDPSAAILVSDGVTNANGTDHDIPSETQCQNCHGKLRERVLGFGAFQLSHPAAGDDLTIESLSNRGWLTVPAPQGFEVPGTPVQQAALGYLHGNCGGCHNSSAQLPPSSALLLRLLVGQTDYATTDIVASTVGVGTFGEPLKSGAFRIAPMDPTNSSVLTRMQARGSEQQMPPLETTSSELPDTAGGVAAVAAWVASLQ